MKNEDLDNILDRAAVRTATTLSYPTIHRMQRRGEFPSFEKISPGRVGLRQSILVQFLNGRRDWVQVASTSEDLSQIGPDHE